jgi:type I restriction enzyme R subunit
MNATVLSLEKQSITKFFEKSQLIGFTGTPIFAENASKNDLGNTTDL